MPPLLTSLFLVFLAARTGWFPIGGMSSIGGGFADRLHHMVVPVLALALPAVGDVRAAAVAGDCRSDRPAVRAGDVRARRAALAHRVARRAQGRRSGPIASVYGLVVGHAPERIVRRGDHHDVAGPGPPDARRAARARCVPRRRLRGGRLAVSRRRHAPRRTPRWRSSIRGPANEADLASRRSALSSSSLAARRARGAGRWRRTRPTSGLPDLLNAPPTAIHMRDASGQLARGRSSTRGSASASSSSATRRTARRPCRWAGSRTAAWFSRATTRGRRCSCSAPTATGATCSAGCCSARGCRSRLALVAALGADARRRARRRHRRLRRRRDRRAPDAGVRLRPGAAGDVRRAGAALDDAAPARDVRRSSRS